MKKNKKLYSRIQNKFGGRSPAFKFKIAVAVAQGRRHESQGAPCQDVVSGYASRKIAAIVLADGAGSAAHSLVGAQIVVSTFTRVLKENFRRIVKSKEEKARNKILMPIIRSLIDAAHRHHASLKDFASTLLFVATDGKRLLIGQLGDGRIGVRSSATGEWRPILEASKGEFFNETVFVTSKNALTLLQLAIGPADAIDACVIMSDGAEEGLYQRASRTFAPAVSSMMGWVQKHDRLKVESALHSNLKDVIRLKTTDDVSIGYLVF